MENIIQLTRNERKEGMGSYYLMAIESMFWDDEKVLEIVMMVAQYCECTQCH